MSKRSLAIAAAGVGVGGGAPDPNFKNVSLLLQGDVSNPNLTYNAFSDASSNNFAIMPNGDAYGTPFSPYNTSWSNAFPNETDGLALPSFVASGPLDISSGDFTVEAWVYASTPESTSTPTILSLAYNNDAYGLMRFCLFNNGVRLLMKAGGTWQNTNAYGTVVANTWTHIAAVRYGTSVKVYVNGVGYDIATFSGSYETPGTGVYIGSMNGASRSILGNISNLRVLKGVAAYTGDFTPPSLGYVTTSGAASASAYPSTTNVNTSFSASACSLLTCMSNRFIDNSSNNFAITRNGDVAIKSFSPFTDTDTTTGSGYFDGNGDYLSTAYNINWSTLGTYTLEFWVYHTSLSPVNQAYLSTGGSGYTNFYCYANGRVGLGIQGTNEIVTASGAVSVNTWTHIAYTFDGTTTKIYINGVQAASGTTAVYSNNTAALQIANGLGGLPVYGYMSNLRIVLGSALTSFNLTSPLTAVSGTSLLTLQTRGTVQNIGFIDSSPNKFQITKVGNTTQGTFSPYGDLWSNYFDGSGDYLSTPSNAALSLGLSDFTIEFWFYKTGTNTNAPMIDWRDGGTGFLVNNHPTVDQINLYWTATSSSISTITGVQSNSWQHIAFTRSGTTFKSFLNGALQQTTTGSYNSVSSQLIIGKFSGNTSLWLDGYISNLRIVKGRAVYTGNFTPSTVPLGVNSGGTNPPQGTETSLLTCQSNRFIDNSANNFTLTVNGNTSVQRFSPFNPTAAYSAATIGGSGYFDGSGDYLSIADNIAFRMGTGDYTLEAWIYLPAAPTEDYTMVVGSHQYYVSASWMLTIDANRSLRIYGGISATGGTVPLNSWTHVAQVKSGSTLTGYINGVAVVSGSTSADLATNPVNITIGADVDASNGIFKGYMSQVRVVKGTAVYTGNFTPPTLAPLASTGAASAAAYPSTTNVNTSFTNTSLLCNFTNAGIPDLSMQNNLETVGNAQVSTSVKKYGTGSLYFDGTGDSLKYPPSALYDFGSGDCTFEAFVYISSFATNRVIVSTLPNASGVTAYSFLVLSSGYLAFDTYLAGTNQAIIANSNAIPLNTWTHVAYTRSGGTNRLFVNGVLCTTSTNNLTQVINSGGNVFYVGQQAYAGYEYYWNGYIDDLRVTKGLARYTANFTPPTQSLPKQ